MSDGTIISMSYFDVDQEEKFTDEQLAEIHQAVYTGSRFFGDRSPIRKWFMPLALVTSILLPVIIIKYGLSPESSFINFLRGDFLYDAIPIFVLLFVIPMLWTYLNTREKKPLPENPTIFQTTVGIVVVFYVPFAFLAALALLIP